MAPLRYYNHVFVIKAITLSSLQKTKTKTISLGCSPIKDRMLSDVDRVYVFHHQL